MPFLRCGVGTPHGYRCFARSSQVSKKFCRQVGTASACDSLSHFVFFLPER